MQVQRLILIHMRKTTYIEVLDLLFCFFFFVAVIIVLWFFFPHGHFHSWLKNQL